MNRRRMIRRGATYGPHLPEGAPEDGMERGIAAFVICASLIRQFEFAQNVWVNDRNFHELGNERDPIIGNQDGTLEFKIPKRPIRKKITGLPAFTTVRGGAYFFLPGLKALRYLRRRCPMAVPNPVHETTWKDPIMSTDVQPARTYNQNHVAAPVHAGQTPGQHLLDLELSVGGQPRSGRHGQSLLDHDRGAPRGLAGLRDARSGSAMNFLQGIAGTLELFHRSTLSFPADRRRGHRPSGRRLPAHRPGRLQAARSTSGFSPTPTR